MVVHLNVMGGLEGGEQTRALNEFHTEQNQPVAVNDF